MNNSTPRRWTSAESMAVNAARLLKDSEVVLVGVGLPNLACNLAARTHAPSLMLVYESGVIGARPARLPLSIGDPVLTTGALMVCSMYEIFAHYLQSGRIDVGFIGGAQIDRMGRINSTVIGDYQKPTVRLPGSGGAMEIAAWAHRCFIVAPHERRRFPEQLDFCTSVPRRGVGVGPIVVTDIGILEPDESGELVLKALHPGRTAAEAVENTGWPLRISPYLSTTLAPTSLELRVLREDLDPKRVYLD